MRGRGHRVKIFVLRTPFANICSKPIRFSPSGPQQNALHVATFSLTGGTNTDPPKVLRADRSITIWIDMSHHHHCMKSSVRLLSFTIRISMGVMIPVNQVCICGRHSGLFLLFSNGNYLLSVCPGINYYFCNCSFPLLDSRKRTPLGATISMRHRLSSMSQNWQSY